MLIYSFINTMFDDKVLKILMDYILFRVSQNIMMVEDSEGWILHRTKPWKGIRVLNLDISSTVLWLKAVNEIRGIKTFVWKISGLLDTCRGTAALIWKRRTNNIKKGLREYKQPSGDEQGAGIWIRALVAGILSMLAGLILSLVVLIYGLKGFSGAMLSILGMGMAMAGLYLAIKGFTGYMAAKISGSRGDKKKAS